MVSGTFQRRLRRLLGVLLGGLVVLWCRTLRVIVEGSVPDEDRDADVDVDVEGRQPGAGRQQQRGEGQGQRLGRRVFAFLHGQQLVLLGMARERRLAVLVSHSLDGELQAGVMGGAGFHVVRGSSSRGGASGLAGIISLLRGGLDAAFAVDGPRGPYGVARGGAVLAARAARARVVPVAGSLGRGLVLGRAWDRFQIPLPFSRVVVVIGSPLDPREATAEDLTRSLADATERARALAHGESP